MIKAILAGKKTVTRRVIRPMQISITGEVLGECPYGYPGHRLWVRETFALVDGGCFHDGAPTKAPDGFEPLYRADFTDGAQPRWFPAIHMPRWCSRVTLEITSVRDERLQDITEAEARAEGVDARRTDEDCWSDGTYRSAFEYLWGEINGWDGDPKARATWASNPRVWVVGFRVAEVRS